MDYEKKYNDALDWMRKVYPTLNGSTKEDAEHYFPELKETEDERIRREMIEYFHGCIQRNKKSGFRVEQIKGWIAYLAKQKDERELSFIEGKMEGVRQTCQEIKDAMSLFEPKDLTPFEFTFRDYIDSAIHYCLSGEGYQQYIKEWAADLLNLEKQKDKVVKFDHDIEQKPAEWSEFDKGALKDAICAADRLGNDESFNKSNPNLAKAFRVAKDWLKSLPERFTLQPEQEVVDRTVFDRIADILRWCDLPIGCPIEDFKQSESEREHLLHIVQCVAHRYANSCTYCKEYSRGYQDGLAVPHWKPSEEQMRCLWDCVSKAKEIHNASVGGYDAYRVLVSLYGELHKLL